MNIQAEEPEEDYDERMAEAVDRLEFITDMMANYYEVCPHCLAIKMAATFEAAKGEPKQEHRPQ